MYEIYCKLRDEKGVKDADVAREANITKSTFSDWKNGRSMPKPDKLSRIAEYFNVPVDYLMTGEKPEVPMIAWTPEHLEVVELFDKLNKEQKTAILTMMRTLALS